jgi:hypothetical protein
MKSDVGAVDHMVRNERRTPNALFHRGYEHNRLTLYSPLVNAHARCAKDYLTNRDDYTVRLAEALQLNVTRNGARMMRHGPNDE